MSWNISVFSDNAKGCLLSFCTLLLVSVLSWNSVPGAMDCLFLIDLSASQGTGKGQAALQHALLHYMLYR